MPNQNRVEVVFLLDASGSMESLHEAAVTGRNELLESQKQDGIDTTYSEYHFSLGPNNSSENFCRTVVDRQDLSDVKPMEKNEFVPNGITPLYDSLVYAVNDVGRKLAALPEEDRPVKVIFAIMTDGLENASREYANKPNLVQDKIQHQRDFYNWEFLYMGANQDAVLEAGKLGISPQYSMNYAPTHAGTRAAYTNMSTRLSSMRRSAVGNAIDISKIEYDEASDLY